MCPTPLRGDSQPPLRDSPGKGCRARRRGAHFSYLFLSQGSARVPMAVPSLRGGGCAGGCYYNTVMRTTYPLLISGTVRWILYPLRACEKGQEGPVGIINRGGKDAGQDKVK